MILAALAGTFGDGTQRAAAKAMRAVLTNPRTVLKAMEFYAKLTGELPVSPAGHRLPRTTAARPVTITWNTSDDPNAGGEVGVIRPETELNPKAGS